MIKNIYIYIYAFQCILYIHTYIYRVQIEIYVYEIFYMIITNEKTSYCTAKKK